MTRSYGDCQKLALARHAATGEPHCLIEFPDDRRIQVVPESDVLAGGPQWIDRMLWSSDFAQDDAIDAALLA